KRRVASEPSLSSNHTTGGGLYMQPLRCLSQNRAQRYSLSVKLRSENSIPGSPVKESLYNAPSAGPNVLLMGRVGQPIKSD
ncbi:hypothetical protein A2U01_0083818, partial [Trifolium medium]|nr:hypothetical protein [Trifolium medium]